MKLLIIVSALAVILCQCYHFTNGSPFPNYKVNELRESDNDSESPLLSSEIMPGRHLTEKEIGNLIYLAQNEHDSKIWPLPEDKKMKTVSRTKRFIFRRSAARREERLRQRLERRKLHLERQRIRQEAQLQRLSFQNQATKHKLEQLSLTRLQPQHLKIAAKFTSITTTSTSATPTTSASATPTTSTSATPTTVTSATPTTSTSVNPTTQSSVTTSTAGTSVESSTTGASTTSPKPVETLPAVLAQSFQQVPLPSGTK